MTVHVCCVGPCTRVAKHVMANADGKQVLVERFETVSQLLQWLFARRLQLEDVTFEGSCLFLCHEPVKTRLRSTSRLDSLDTVQLSYFVRDMFPCFNVVCVAASSFVEYYETVVLQEPHQQLDRISNVHRWMYADSGRLGDKNDSSPCNADTGKLFPGQGCSMNLYTMASHLSYVEDEERNSHETVPIWDYIDVTPWIRSNLPHEDVYYWARLNSWDFCAHSLNCIELIWCAYLLFEKLSSESNLSHTPPGTNRLLLMLLNVEAAYHQSNKFHNFRHAVDVLQATFQLCRILQLPKLASFLLCIAAIGHDVGHPGTNNMLLNKFHSPISKYYKEQSVLENFHADVFLDILARYWPDLSQEFNTIKDSIIATDMALHNHYVESIKKETGPNLTGLTSLIIKAADISNVTRPLLVSAKWAALISMEFNECDVLEKNLAEILDQNYNQMENIRYKLDPDAEGKPELPSNVEGILQKYPGIPKGQAFFIDAFALSLFSGLGSKYESLKFLVTNVENNRQFWKERETL